MEVLSVTAIFSGRMILQLRCMQALEALVGSPGNAGIESEVHEGQGSPSWSYK